MNNSSMNKKFLPAVPSAGVIKQIERFHRLKDELLTEIAYFDVADDFRNAVCIAFGKADETYAIACDKVLCSEIPRHASMICGPVYVSEQYPQPVDSQGNGMFPILQIDLEWLGSITGKDFGAQILQLWWSSKDVSGFTVVLPKNEVLLLPPVSLDISEEAANEADEWIPYGWFCKDRSECYQIVSGVNIGITFPDIDLLIDDFVNDYSDRPGSERVESLFKECRNRYSFVMDEVMPKNAKFNLFGHYKSHSCSPWETASDLCFLHTSDWRSGTMDANIFMSIDERNGTLNFEFGFGR